MNARSNVSDTSGPLMSDHSLIAPLAELSSEGDDPQLESHIREIVAQNAGRAGGPAVARRDARTP